MSLTRCHITKLDGATQFKLLPVPGHEWKGVPSKHSARAFVFDARGSEASRYEWCKALQRHARFGRAVARERALRQVPAAAVQPVTLQEMVACGLCGGQEGSAMCPEACPICLSDFDHRSALGRTPCGHVFHENCARKWLLRRGTCPLCRERLCEVQAGKRASRAEGCAPAGTD